MKRIVTILFAIVAITAQAQTGIPQQYIGLGLPMICITTADGQEPTSEDIMHPEGSYVGAGITNVVPKEARMQIYRADTLWYDSGEYLKDESGIKIKHRGNTSAYYFDNKPFKLSLQKKADLILAEEGDTVNRKSKDWVLLNDAERLQVMIANRMARLIDMEYTPRMEFANVIINGDYRGIYMLSENVKRDRSCRINVDKEEGYIIELDAYFWNETFSIPSKLTKFLQWTLKYPKAEDLTPEMEAYIRSDITQFEASLSSSNYPEVIDVHSVARWILLHDILGTCDSGGSNIYVARTDRSSTSLMRMPVAWDMGSSMCVFNDFSKTHTERGLFFSRLFANELCKDFVRAYIDEWKLVQQSDAIERIRQFLHLYPSTAQAQGLARSYPLHAKRWHIPVPDVGEMSQVALEWFNDREGWLDSRISELDNMTKPVVRILTIGNSYSGDVVESWLSSMARASGTELVIGNAVWGGHTLRKHWQDIVEGNANTEYRKIANGKYTLTSGNKLTDIINDEPWDIITFQQNSKESGLYSTFEPYLGNLIGYVKDIHPKARLGWIMTWAYADYAKKKDGFQHYNYNQTIMYDSIRNATRQVLINHPEIKFVVPCATTIQNLRNSFLGDNINRDGSHLNLYFGRYAAAYTIFATLFGEETATQNSFVPYCMNKFTMNYIRQAVLDAVRNPFIVTPQVYPEYEGDNSVVPAVIQINFSSETQETLGWNNVGLHHNFLAGLKDSSGVDPNIFILYNSEMTNASSKGPSVTDTMLEMPSDVSKTQLYGYSQGDYYGQHQKPEGVFYFHHLNKALAYDFSFYASRIGLADNCETQFKLVGKDSLMVTLDASGNVDKTVTIPYMFADNDGIITLKVSAGPGNSNPYKLYYINALRISAYIPDSTNIDESSSEHQYSTRKFIRDKHLYIVKDNRIYSPDGKRIK